MSVIYAPEERPVNARLLLFPGLIVGVLGAYFMRLWYLQVVTANELIERAEYTGTASVSKLAPRGKILDRNGKLLAGVKPTVVVVAKPKTALKNQESMDKVAQILQVDPQVLTKAIKSVQYLGDLSAPAYVGANVEAASLIAENVNELPGFDVETQAMRFYDAGPEMSHLLGFVRTPRDQDIKRLKGDHIEPAQYVGIQGLERKYERELMGKAGEDKVAVDARRRPIRSLGIDQPIPGSTLILSIDEELQRYAMSLLDGRRGSAVILDPRNGEVLAMVSSPSYDSSIFLKGISKDDYSDLLNSPDKPLFFRATSAAYAPGSIFKIVTTIAAWNTGKFALNSSSYCNGFLKIGNRKFKCLGHHGAVSFERAFTKSCNVYFGDLGVKVGPEALREACQMVGLGSTTGLDLPTESTGVVPTEQWWAKHRERRFSIGDTVNFSVGQGELAVTPLQMACIAALVGNEGISYRPHLLKASIAPGENSKPVPKEIKVLGKVDTSPSNWNLLKHAMFQVIEEGTAKSAKISGLIWGGKTGSAENRKDHQTHSWFVGIAPLDKPQLAICVMVENAGHGGDVAAPIGAKIVKHWLVDRPLKKKVDVNIQSSPKPDTVSSSNLANKPSLRD